jgi:hypothetical protein
MLIPISYSQHGRASYAEDQHRPTGKLARLFGRSCLAFCKPPHAGIGTGGRSRFRPERFAPIAPTASKRHKIDGAGGQRCWGVYPTLFALPPGQDVRCRRQQILLRCLASGLFKNLTPDQEKAFRDIILNGGPTYMPPWKYGLTAEEIDDIVAYLKTLS